jgi:hypothetical protein
MVVPTLTSSRVLRPAGLWESSRSNPEDETYACSHRQWSQQVHRQHEIIRRSVPFPCCRQRWPQPQRKRKGPVWQAETGACVEIPRKFRPIDPQLAIDLLG